MKKKIILIFAILGIAFSVMAATTQFVNWTWVNLQTLWDNLDADRDGSIEDEDWTVNSLVSGSITMGGTTLNSTKAGVLDKYAGVDPSANILSTLGAADYAAARTLWSVYSQSEITTLFSNHTGAADPHPGYMLESNIGVGAGNYIVLDGSGRLPAVDGSQLTNLPSGFSNPMTTAGDIIYGGASGAPTRLGGAISGGLIQQNIIQGLSTSGSASPGFTAYDSDSPGTDKTTGFLGYQYIDGADGSENSDVFIQIIQDGVLTEKIRFDESDDRWEFPTGVHFSIGSVQWDNGSDYIDGAAIEDDGIPAAKVASVMKTEGFSITLGNGSDAITTGTKMLKKVRVPFKHDLSKIVLTTNETAGSITIDVRIDEPGATTGLSEITDADSLFDTASEPSIADASSDNFVETTSFDTGEATDIPAGSYYVIAVDAASTLTLADVSFEMTRKD